MKKILILVTILCSLIFGTMCYANNRDYFDFGRNYNYALIDIGEGKTWKVEIKSWCDSEDTEYLCITTKDGNEIYTSTFKCILFKNRPIWW